MLLQIGDSRNTANRDIGFWRKSSLHGVAALKHCWSGGLRQIGPRGGFGEALVGGGSTSGQQFFISFVSDSQSIGEITTEYLLKA